MINQEQTNGEGLYGTSKKHNIPIEHFDFKYAEKCNDVKELEKIYKVLVSGSEGKYIELENFVAEKLKKLAPNSRVLRRDAPILTKSAIPREEQKIIEEEMNDFLNQIPDLEDKVKVSTDKDTHNDYDYIDNGEIPPVRNPVVLNIKNNQQKSQVTKTEIKKTPATNGKPAKSVKPKDYKEWDKIEKELEKTLDQEDDTKTETKKETLKVANDTTQINTNNLTKKLIKNLNKEVSTNDLTEEQKLIKAEAEKCKGNEAFNANCYEEALVYYTRSIQYLPSSASYNNRAMTYLKLEKWDKCIDDCDYVIKSESNNVKARLRRATAYLKKKKFPEAKQDLDTALKLEPTNKKGNELMKELEAKIKQHEEEKVKLNGANRLLIEETDGSSDEEEVKEIKLDEKLKTTTSTPSKTTSIPQPAKVDETIKKTTIKIAEVESDDESEEEEVIENLKPIEEKVKEKPAEKDLPIENKPIEVVKLELPEKVLKLKDDAFKMFSNGQYGNACDLYSNSINNLKQVIEITSNEQLSVYYKSSLSTLINNKAACLQKIGDYKGCINECNQGLDLLNSLIGNDQNLGEEYKGQKKKFIFKKAHSLELLEKYKDALAEYETLMRLDSTFQNVQINYNRIKKMLIDSGELKVNKEQVITKKDIDSNIDSNKTDVKKEEINEKLDQSQAYEENKQKGNDFVKLNDYKNALNFYNKCIEIDSSNPVAYLNRSLCFIKLNKPDEAISDCSFVLSKDCKNVKALFRRSNANKIKKLYNLVADDLKLLLSIEPNNQIAIKEFDSIKPYLTTKTQPEKKIEIIETNEKKFETKPTSNVKPAVKVVEKDLKSPVLDQISFKSKKSQDFSKVTNAYEFLQSWNSINPKDKEGYAALLASVETSNLPKLIGSKLDDDMLSKMIESIYMLSSQEEMKPKLFDYLKQLSCTQRFTVTKLFISNAQKEMLHKIIQPFDEKNADIIKKLYDL